MKVYDSCIPKPQQLILMSPSGVQEEKMEPEMGLSYLDLLQSHTLISPLNSLVVLLFS